MKKKINNIDESFRRGTYIPNDKSLKTNFYFIASDGTHFLEEKNVKIYQDKINKEKANKKTN
jgi:hypothetical protein